MDDRVDIIITVTHAGRQPLALLLGEELVVGRDCEGLVIPDSEVSRRHLRLRRRGRAVEVIDLQSTNGTLVDGQRLTGSELVSAGAEVAIGDTRLSIDIALPGALSATMMSGRATEVRVDELRSTSIDLVADAVSSRSADGAARRRTGDTVTIVFSDIESSTERAAALGDASWFDLVEAHNRLFRSALSRWGGREIKSMGDGFMLTFPSVAKALGFADDVQHRVDGDDELDLRVRMGAHTGEAIADATGDLLGRHVIMAARVANLADGGQVLTSRVTREIAAGQNQFRFGDPIMAELKGLDGIHQLHELLWRRTND